MQKMLCWFLSVAALTLLGSDAVADIILFNDAPQNGMTYWADGGSTSGPTEPGDPVYSGTTAVKISQGSWSQAGIKDIGGATAEFPILRLRYYRVGGGDFVLRLGNGNSAAVWLRDSGPDDNSEFWTIDGENGYANNTANEWHTLEIDVAGMGLSHPVARIGTGNSSGTDVWYFDDVAWVAVPEPASLALFSLGAFALASRGRRASA